MMLTQCLKFFSSKFNSLLKSFPLVVGTNFLLLTFLLPGWQKRLQILEFITLPFVTPFPSSVLVVTLKKKKVDLGAHPEVHKADSCQVFCLTSNSLFTIITSFLNISCNCILPFRGDISFNNVLKDLYLKKNYLKCIRGTAL